MAKRSLCLTAAFLGLGWMTVFLNAAERPVEGELAPLLGEAKLDMQQVYNGDRFPNIVVAMDGTVLAFFNGVRVRRSEDGGETRGDEIMVGKGFMGGGVVVNESNSEILAFVEQHHPPADRGSGHPHLQQLRQS